MQAIVRGTNVSDKRKWFKDTVGNADILTGTNRYNRRFQQSRRHLNKFARKMMTNNKGRIYDNVTYKKKSGPLDVLRSKSNSVYDVSNRYDPISMFARLGQKKFGNKQSIKNLKSV